MSTQCVIMGQPATHFLDIRPFRFHPSTFSPAQRFGWSSVSLCFSAVPGCCGVDHLVMNGPGPKRSQCISCAYQDNGCDATSLEAYAEAMLAAGHTILDGEAPALAPESALRAVRSYAMQCPPFMDATGAREWDCSLWLTALLSCAAGRAIVGVEPPDTGRRPRTPAGLR